MLGYSSCAWLSQRQFKFNVLKGTVDLRGIP